MILYYVILSFYNIILCSYQHSIYCIVVLQIQQTSQISAQLPEWPPEGSQRSGGHVSGLRGHGQQPLQ